MSTKMPMPRFGSREWHKLWSRFAEQPRMGQYIDVRGPNPVLIDGMQTTVLHNQPRSITVAHVVKVRQEQGV